MIEIPRIIQLNDFFGKKSCFLFGSRATGKSSVIASQLGEDAIIIDLLDSRYFLPLTQNPSYLEEIANVQKSKIVVIDEIQKFPALLDEVHRIIEKDSRIFLLTGSSARKLKRENANLLGGRATQSSLYPFTWFELNTTGHFDLEKYLRFGSLPRVYLSSNPQDELYDYIDTYLTQEIQIESEVRNLPTFSRFLKSAALFSGEICN